MTGTPSWDAPQPCRAGPTACRRRAGYPGGAPRRIDFRLERAIAAAMLRLTGRSTTAIGGTCCRARQSSRTLKSGPWARFAR